MSNPIQQAISALETCLTSMKYIHEKTGFCDSLAELLAEEALSALQSLQRVELPPLPAHTDECNALWDHVYEYGHAAEGVHERLESVCKAYARTAVAAAMARGVVPSGWKLVPSGWRLVPVEPTPEMIGAMAVVDATMTINDVATLGMAGAEESYEAMLAAAPTPEATQPEPCKSCNGEGGYEKALSSTNYTWVKCPNCEGTCKATQPTQAEAPSEREAFEQHVTEGGKFPGCAHRDADGNYTNPLTHPARRSWLAALRYAALATQQGEVPHCPQCKRADGNVCDWCPSIAQQAVQAEPVGYAFFTEDGHLTPYVFDTEDQAMRWLGSGDETRIRAVYTSAVAAALGRGVVPSGWKLVPEEPTEEMFFDPEAVCVNFNESAWDAFLRIYRAMLAAAPSPEATQPTQAEAPSDSTIELAEMILADCGHSTAITTRLRDRVAERIERHLTTHPAPEQAAQAEAPSERETMTERDHFDFAMWHKRLGELADAYYEAGRTNPARERARADLMLHACNAVTGWRARAALATQQAVQGEPDWWARDMFHILHSAAEACEEMGKDGDWDANYAHSAAMQLRALASGPAPGRATPPAPQQPEALAQQERDREDGK